MKNKNLYATLVILLSGLVLAIFVQRMGKVSVSEDAHGNAGPEKNSAIPVKGTHGGRLLSKNNFQIELVIHERGVPPEFRAWLFEEGKPVDIEEVKLVVTLHRLGGRVDEIHFHKEGGYLRGDKIVEEPHSFDVKVVMERKGLILHWEYSQVEGRVQMTPETMKSAGIEVATAGSVPIKIILELPGEIELNKNKVAHIVSRFPGIIAEVRKNLGDKIAKNEVIAIIDSRKLAEAKSDYITSVHRLEFAQASFVREKSLWEKKISAEQDYLASHHELEEAEIARQVAEQKLLALGLSRADLSVLAIEPAGTVREREVRVPFAKGVLTRYKLKSPIDGTIIEKRVAVGEAIKEDADIFVIADLSTVRVGIAVYAGDLNAVRLGQKITVKAKALEQEATGTISYLGSLVDEQTRTAKAYVDIPNAKGLWRPGLFVTVEVLQEESPVPVAVPVEAIQTFRDWPVVFVSYGDLFEVRPLRLGRSDGKWVEVISGLSPGEQYVSRNSFVFKADLGKTEAAHE